METFWRCILYEHSVAMGGGDCHMVLHSQVLGSKLHGRQLSHTGDTSVFCAALQHFTDNALQHVQHERTWLTPRITVLALHPADMSTAHSTASEAGEVL